MQLTLLDGTVHMLDDEADDGADHAFAEGLLNCDEMLGGELGQPPVTSC